MDIDTALAFAGRNTRSILVTLRRNGRPQSSNVVHSVADDGRIAVSVTEDRAKTRNARRDPRVSLHVLGPDFWSYVVVEGEAELGPTAADPHDEAAEALVRYYRAAAGEHPDWDEFRSVMVAERRLLLSIRPTHAYGMVPG